MAKISNTGFAFRAPGLPGADPYPSEGIGGVQGNTVMPPNNRLQTLQGSPGEGGPTNGRIIGQSPTPGFLGSAPISNLPVPPEFQHSGSFPTTPYPHPINPQPIPPMFGNQAPLPTPMPAFGPGVNGQIPLAPSEFGLQGGDFASYMKQYLQSTRGNPLNQKPFTAMSVNGKPVIQYSKEGGQPGPWGAQPTAAEQFGAAAHYDRDMRQNLANHQYGVLTGAANNFLVRNDAAAQSIGAMGKQQGDVLRGVGDQERQAFAQEQAAIIGGFRNQAAQNVASQVFANKGNVESTVNDIMSDPNLTPGQRRQALDEFKNQNDAQISQAVVAASNNYNEGMAQLRSGLSSQMLNSGQLRENMYQMAASLETAAEAARQQYLTSGMVNFYNMRAGAPPSYFDLALAHTQMAQFGNGGGGGYMGPSGGISRPNQQPMGEEAKVGATGPNKPIARPSLDYGDGNAATPENIWNSKPLLTKNRALDNFDRRYDKGLATTIPGSQSRFVKPS